MLRDIYACYYLESNTPDPDESSGKQFISWLIVCLLDDILCTFLKFINFLNVYIYFCFS